MSTFMLKRADKRITILTSRAMCVTSSSKCTGTLCNEGTIHQVIGTSAISCGHESVILSRLSVGEIVREFFQPSKQENEQLANRPFRQAMAPILQSSSILMIDAKEIIDENTHCPYVKTNLEWEIFELRSCIQAIFVFGN